MKIMWIVNTIFPYPASKLNYGSTPFGGWLTSLYDSLEKNDNFFAIVTTYKGKDFKMFEFEKTKYYLLPDKRENKYNKKLEKYYTEIVNTFNPDIVHIHGTEYPKSLPLVRSFPTLNYLISIQGLLTPYSRVVNCNLSFTTLLKNITIRDILKPKSGLLVKIDFLKRVKYEKELIESVKNIAGRTTWDYANAKAINPLINYHKLEESLRVPFYLDSWNYSKCSKHTIFMSQGQSIIKGLYLAIEALHILKNKYNYSDVKLVITGKNLFDKTTITSRLKTQSYTKYMMKLVKKYGLSNNIIFTGFLPDYKVKEELLKANVYIQTSSIENSSNSLAEAMILGVPIVASNVGGTSDMLIDKEEGLLYPYTEYELLAYYVSLLFEDKELGTKLGINARNHALTRHNTVDNASNVLKVYSKIISK